MSFHFLFETKIQLKVLWVHYIPLMSALQADTESGHGITWNLYFKIVTYPADTAFPNLDENPDWELEEKGEMQEEKGVRFSFDVYKKR